MIYDRDIDQLLEVVEAQREELGELHARIDAVFEIIFTYGGDDGADHKAWVLDQVIRSLCGTDSEYERWVRRYQFGPDGPDTYVWDTGVEP